MKITAQQVGGFFAVMDMIARGGQSVRSMFAFRAVGVTNEQIAEAFNEMEVVRERHDTMHLDELEKENRRRTDNNGVRT